MVTLKATRMAHALDAIDHALAQEGLSLHNSTAPDWNGRSGIQWLPIIDGNGEICKGVRVMWYRRNIHTIDVTYTIELF